MSLLRRIPVALGIDIGTTNTKVVALDEAGAVVARASRPTPRSAADLWVRAEDVLTAVDEMALEVCRDGLRVHALSVAGVGEDGVLVDAHLHPLSPALAWYDPRRREILDELRADLVDDGTFDVDIDPVCSLVGWAWARRQPSAADARAWLALTDLAAARWTGRPFLSDTLAPRTGAWRSASGAWALDRVERTLGDAALLPPVHAAGEVLGEVGASALRAAGILAPDAIAVVGGHDHPIAAWGVRRLIPGAVLDSMGTAEVIIAENGAAPASRRKPRVDLAPAILADGVSVLRIEELARNVQWASRDPDVAEQIRALLVGSRAPLPLWDSGYFLRGERGGGVPAYAADAPRDPRARASAVLGALAAAGRDAVDAVKAGADSGPVRFAGGWVRSPGWLQIKSAVHGSDVAPILEPEVTAVGAAMLAATARGWNPDPVHAFGGFTVDMLR